MVDYRLELILLPVADVDRAKEFYTQRVGFNLDVDTSPREGFRVVQMTPPGVGVLGHDRDRLHRYRAGIDAGDAPGRE